MNALFAQYERFAFGFDWAKAPLNTWHTPVIACTAYLLLVAALYPRAKAMAAEFKAAKERGEERPVTFMTHVFAYHNLGICLASLVMFVGGAFEVYRRITGAVEYSQHGAQYGKSDQLDFSFLFCESTATVSKGPIFLWVRNLLRKLLPPRPIPLTSKLCRASFTGFRNFPSFLIPFMP